jgi:hypothetical protein
MLRPSKISQEVEFQRDMPTMDQENRHRKIGIRVIEKMLRKKMRKIKILIGLTSIQKKIETNSLDMLWLMSNSLEKQSLSKRKTRKRKLNKRNKKQLIKPR